MSNGADTKPERQFSWKRHLTLVGLGVVLVLFAYLFAVAFLPRWWAQRIADQVDGRFGAGIGWGLFYGIVFTLVPLLIARQALRADTWRIRGIVVAAAVVLATPNLLTLGVVLGNGNAAHAGERILDVEAPAFRAATLFGAIGAAIVALGAFLLLAAGRRDRRQLRELKSTRKSRDKDRDARDGNDRTPDAEPATDQRDE
jgi:MFS family permease